MPFETPELSTYRYLEGMVRCGRITKVRTDNCVAATVTYPDRNFQTPYMTVLQRNTVGTQDFYVPVPGESVWVIQHGKSLNRGLILGSAYTETHPPPYNSATIRAIVYGDGSYVLYDTSGGGVYQVNVKGQVQITSAGVTVIKASAITLDAPTVTFTGTIHCDNYVGYQGTPTATPKMANQDGSGGGS